MPRKAAPWFRKSTGRWYVTIDGKKTPLPVTDPKDEAGAWDAFRALVSKAILESPTGPAIRSEPIAALIPDYLDAIRHKVAAKTVRDYACYLRRFSALFGNSAPGEIEAKSVELHALKEKWSDSNRANYLWAVQAFVRWAGRADFSLHRPAKESRGAEAIISEETQRLILRETTGDFHELCRLLWCVGCRPMEAARITAEMVDWSSGTITLKQHKTRHKGKKRTLYLSTEALTILRAQADKYANSGYLFRGIAGKPMTVHAIVCRMIRVSDRIGRPVTAYGYRHSYATRALAQGIPDTHVAALLGHTSTAMIHAHYSHVSENAKLLREIASKVA